MEQLGLDRIPSCAALGTLARQPALQAVNPPVDTRTAVAERADDVAQSTIRTSIFGL
jgi:hypothetical protein